MGGNSGPNPTRIDDDGDDGVPGRVRLPIPAQDIPLGLRPAPAAELRGLHISDYMVGHCS